MRGRRLARMTVLIGVAVAAASPAVLASPAIADVTSALNSSCGSHEGLGGLGGVAGLGAGTGCGQPGKSLLNAGGDLLSGNVGGAAGGLVGGAAGALASSTAGAVLAGVDGLVTGSAQDLLNQTASAMGSTTSPRLRSTWFSSTYWRMAAIATVLTLPFLFAAAVQALIRSDVALLARAAFGYLPLAMLAIAIAAPLTTLVLAACDQLCSFISAAAGNASAHFLGRIGLDAATAAALGAPFLGFLVGLFMIAAAFTLWVELLLREAAVYVIVLMLPLGFAAFVWPARRIWAIRAVELLVALILSKFAIVAVLSLGGAAVGSAGSSLTTLMAGAVLIMLATFSPWALLRLIPLSELASGAVGPLRGELRAVRARAEQAAGQAPGFEEWMRRAVDMPSPADVGGADGGGPPRGQPAPEPGGQAVGSRAPGAEVAGTGAPTPPPAEVVDQAASSAPTGAATASTGATDPVTTAAGAPESATTSAGPSGQTTTAGAGGPPAPSSTAGETQPADDEPPASRTEASPEPSVLEFDLEHFDSTPVWPNENAL